VVAPDEPVADRGNTVDGQYWIVRCRPGSERPGREELAVKDKYVTPIRSGDSRAAVDRKIDREGISVTSALIHVLGSEHCDNSEASHTQGRQGHPNDVFHMRSFRSSTCLNERSLRQKGSWRNEIAVKDAVKLMK
jgi:hypothetical protein